MVEHHAATQLEIHESGTIEIVAIENVTLENLSILKRCY